MLSGDEKMHTRPTMVMVDVNDTIGSYGMSHDESKLTLLFFQSLLQYS